MATIYPTVRGGSWTDGASAGGGSISIDTPSQARPGDLLVWSLAFRNQNAALPAGWTNLVTSAGASDTNVGTAIRIGYLVAPDPVPASYSTTGPSFNYAMAMSCIDGRIFESLGPIDTQATTSATATPGSLTLAQPALVLAVLSHNSGSNTDLDTHSSANYTLVSGMSATPVAGRMHTTHWRKTQAGSGAPGTLSLTSSESHTVSVIAWYGKDDYEVSTY